MSELLEWADIAGLENLEILPVFMLMACKDQIKRKNYPAKVAEYTGDILLVGVTYDRQAKTHSCIIEKCVK